MIVLDPQTLVLHALSTGSVDPARTVDAPTLRPYTAVLLPLAFNASLPILAAVGVEEARAVIGEAEVRVVAPLRPGAELRVHAEHLGTWDLGAYALHRLRCPFSSEGAPAGEATLDVFVHGAGGFGGAPPPRGPRRLLPNRSPDAVFPVAVAANAALLYRLLGDANPLHYDPAVAAAWPALTGGRPILHGLAGVGLVERVLTEAYGPVTALRARFARPIWPGDVLELAVWREGEQLQVRLRRGEEDVWTAASAALGAEGHAAGG